ncbi:MAG: hypothetical protein V4447_10540 [Pseudomonadota bacterium]
MFSLNKDSCIVEHINIRTEIHGDQDVTAYDLKFSHNAHNHKLEDFSTGLRESFYKPDENATADMLDDKHMPNLIHNCLPEVIALRNEIASCLLRIYEDGTNDALIVVKGGKLGKFKISPKDGGSVPMTFTYSFSDPYGEYWALIGPLLKCAVKIDLEQVTVQDEDAAGAQSDAENPSGDIFGEGVKEQADQAQLDKVANEMRGDPDFREVSEPAWMTEEEIAAQEEEDRIAAEKAHAIDPEKPGRVNRKLKSV